MMRSNLAVGALFACLLSAVPASAAPAPLGRVEKKAWVRGLPADTNGLYVVDGKALACSPLVRESLGGKLPPILGRYFQAPGSLKRLGLAPTKDVRAMAVVTAPGEWRDGAGRPTAEGSPLFLLQTTKSSSALKAGVDAAVKNAGAGVKAVVGARGAYVLKQPGRPAFLAVLPGGVLAVSLRLKSVESALARAGAAARPLQHAEVAEFVRGLKPGAVARGLFLPGAVLGTAPDFSPRPGAGRVRLNVLGGQNCQGLRFEVKASYGLRVVVELVCKNAAVAARSRAEAYEKLERAKEELQRQAGRDARARATLEGLCRVAMRDAGKVLRIEAELGPEVVKAMEALPPGLGG